MAFSKEEMQEELMVFMKGFVDSVMRMYGGPVHNLNDDPFADVTQRLASEETIEGSWLWLCVNEMYDFGITGIPSPHIGHAELDGSFADVELFLRGLDSLEDYLEEDCVRLPRLSRRAVRTAVARHVLEGGERYVDFGAAEHGWGNGDWGYLTLQEVALLADMDERSVRNAASQKQPGALKTKTVGKRSLVEVEEARRWLSGRKGFVPTQKPAEKSHEEAAKTVEIQLPSPTAELLESKAKEAGLSVADFLKARLASE